MSLPNFLIVGAAKCGTTSLFHYIRQHPEVGMLECKDANFFVDFRSKVKTLEEYEALYAGFSGKKALGEAPVRALWDRDASEKIKRLIPEVKIVISMRNPAEAAHSLWGHLVRNGERLSFRAALKKEAKRMSDPEFRRMANNWHADYYYFSRYLYFEQVRHYIETFGGENVRTYLFDDFKEDPVKVCQDIFRFIGVGPDFVPEIERHNVGRVFRHRGLHKLVSQPPAWIKRIGSVLPEGITSGIKDTLVKINTRGVPPLDRKMKSELTLKYASDIKKLERLIGRDLSAWLKA